MQRKSLGNAGPEVGALGLGCMRLTPLRGGHHDFDETEGVATIQAALDAGMSLLNTGDFYSMGANELLVSKAIKGRRNDAFISVKFGPLPGSFWVSICARKPSRTSVPTR